MLLKFGVFEHQGTKSSSRRTGGNTDRDAPGGGSWYAKYHRGECKYRHQSQRQEDAEHSSGGSQGGHPIRTGFFRMLRFELAREKLSIENELR